MIDATRRLPYALRALKHIRVHVFLIEMAVLLTFWGLYIGQWLPLDPQRVPHALEHERLSGVLLPIEIGIKTYGRIPTWNPYIGSGTPTLNNPFNYLFNPFASLPILLLGGVEGSKLATALSLLLAAVNTWALAKAIGLGSTVRVLAGALYMMSGGIAGKFYIGHFQLALSLAWPPLVLAGLWWTLRTQNRCAPLLMATAFALLFFTGNIYYTLHTLVCAFVITLANVVTFDINMRRFRVQLAKLKWVVLGGLFAFGLSMVQFAPVWAINQAISHTEDPGLTRKYTLDVALGNYTTPWEAWFPQENLLEGLIGGVDYAYIGGGVLGLIVGASGLLLIPTVRRSIPHGWMRTAFIMGFLGLLMTAWGAGQTSLIQTLYASIPLLAEFRYVGRALAMGGLWWILLAAMALDVLLRTVRAFVGTYAVHDHRWFFITGVLCAAAWPWFLVYSTGNSTLRLTFALRDLRLFNALNERRWTTPAEATQGFWAVLLAGLFIQAALFLLIILMQQRQVWRRLSGHFGHTALLIIAGLLIADVMHSNSALFKYRLVDYNYSSTYAYARQTDPTPPFPIINEAFSPLSYATYYNHVRNWGLNEGWIPEALPSIIPPEAGMLSPLPRWTMVGEWAAPLEQEFAQSNGYRLRFCVLLGSTSAAFEPCILNLQKAVYLYELPTALPYAYVVEADTLLTRPSELHADDVIHITSIAHEMDTITLNVNVPDIPGERYTLVIQETNFPGWNVQVNDEPVAHYGVQRFIGLDVTGGPSTVRLHYEPPGFMPGLVVSLLTSLVMVTWLLYGWLTTTANSKK